MRTMMPSLLILFLLSGATPAVAQLPPDIIADSYLLRAEQAVRDGDHARARDAINKILDLQKEHDLELPTDFHFRYAKAADSSDWPEQALESVVRYLTAAGREGQHYVEALELMNQAQDEIAGRKEPPAASTEPSAPAQAPSHGAAVAQLGDRGTHEVQAEKRDPLHAGGMTERRPPPDCNLRVWNTEDYFWTATVQSVKACLAAGGDPNARNEYNKSTPLHMAALYNKNPAVIDVLLAAGADLHALAAGYYRNNKWQSTPLHWAARNNDNPMVVQALLAAGADLKSRDVYKRTPLHLAAQYNDNPMVVQALLAAGADLKSRDKYKRTPLWLAENYRNLAVIEILRRKGGPPILSVQDCGMWPSRVFFRTATVQDVKTCLAAGADPNARGINKRTPLHSAAEYNENPGVVQALLAAGAKLEAKTDYESDSYSRTRYSGSGYRALHFAARGNENPAVTQALIDAGAKVSPSAGTMRNTPLRMAARHNKNPAVIKTLLAAGADLHDGTAFTGSTAVHYATKNENPAMIEALLKAGADPNARDDDKETPLHWVTGVAGNENPAVIQALIDAGADPNARNKSKWTPLHWAAGTAVVELLLKAGADVKAETEDKWTPLHWAARYDKNPAGVELLLKAGADVKAEAKDKWTPLHWAAKNNENPAMVELLLKAGADLGAQDKDGRTPLQLASKHNENPAVRQALLTAGAGQIENQLAAARARRKSESGPSFLEAAIGIVGGTAIAAAGGGTEEAVAAGTIFAEGVIGGQQPVGNSGGAPGVAPTGNVGGGGGQCEIPGYPRPADVKNLGLSWCPATVDFQVRALALQVAGAQCAMATGSSSTPAQIQARRQEIQAACARLAALGVSNCRCP